MDGFTMVLIVIFVIGISIAFTVRRNKSIDVELDKLRNVKEEAEKKITTANAACDELASVVRVSREGMEPESLIDALADYQQKYDDALDALNRFQTIRDDCVDAINRGVRIQNLILGGANDLSVVGLRNREDQYNDLSKLSVKLIDTTKLRIGASILVDRLTHE